jgi:hypothetical protein
MNFPRKFVALIQAYEINAAPFDSHQFYRTIH